MGAYHFSRGERQSLVIFAAPVPAMPQIGGSGLVILP